MDTTDVGSFLSGTLNTRKITENSFHHTIKYFKFPQKGKRNVTQVRSFILGLGIPLNYVSNINLINEDILELSFMKGYSQLIESRLTIHLELLSGYRIDQLFEKM